jgi:hypothetical protein
MYTLFPPVAIIALAVFMGIQNRNAAVRQLFVDTCNAIISTSPFTDISVTDLRDACAQENLYDFGRSVIWTAARSALQVHLIKRSLTVGVVFQFYWIMDGSAIHRVGSQGERV